jgi:hypothetical protein
MNIKRLIGGMDGHGGYWGGWHGDPWGAPVGLARR